TRADHGRAGVARLAAGLLAGFAAVAGAAGVPSQPPRGVATLTASSGWGSAGEGWVAGCATVTSVWGWGGGVKVWIASFAAASDWASSRLAMSSRLWDASVSPCAA